MRPRIVEALNGVFDTTIFAFLIPDPAFVYALAIGVCAWLFVRRTKEAGLSQYHALGGVIWGVIGGFVGARFFFLATHYERVIYNYSMLFDLNGATVSWGAYLGGTIAFLAYFRLKNTSPLTYLDVVASCLGLGICVARWSCFLNGDDFGTLSTAPWAVAFPHGSYPFAAQVKLALVDALAPRSLPIHPVQIYGSLKGLLLFAVFTYLWRRNHLPPGILFCLLWMAFATLRFGLEFFRGDVSRGFVGLLSTGQVMSLVIFGVCGIVVASQLVRKRMLAL
ncbi:MAG: prolipoprotein diacylglyceryl transferase [Ignavibacteriae bacterium]|nr:prolipoprotein diacylglyceryl transferase [Ignavibacteriota bacterium]